MRLNIYRKRKFSFRRAFWLLVRDYIFRLSPYHSNGIRCSLLRLFGAKIGKDVVIRPSVCVDSPWNLKIGDYSWIGENVLLNNIDKISIGSNCCISQGGIISSASHDYKKESFDTISSPVYVKDRVWIGAGSMVHPGVSIGSDSVIGAMSNVLKDIAPNTLNFGNPCRFIRKR